MRLIALLMLGLVCVFLAGCPAKEEAAPAGDTPPATEEEDQAGEFGGE